VTACIVCPPGPEGETHEPDVERGWLCCYRAWARMAHALGRNGIPLLVDELAGLGYVERDLRRERCSTPACFLRDRPVDVIATVRQERPKQPRPGVRLCADCAAGLKIAGRIVEHIAIPARPADPVAYPAPAGPVNGARNGPRVAGTGEHSLPIRVDPTDLLLPSRPASLAVAETGLYAADQVGHLSVATELEFWARDWADARGERAPYPTVHELSRWLLDRLEWACATPELALDEFAGKLRGLLGALTAAAGRFDAPPEVMHQPCPRCQLLTLVRESESGYIVCGECGRAMTSEEYAEYLRGVLRDVQGG
jgi:hypothetical protein